MLLASANEYDPSMAPGREWNGTTRRSSGNIMAMNRLMYDGPKSIFTANISTTPNDTRTCRATGKEMSLIVPSSSWVGWKHGLDVDRRRVV